MPLTTYKEARPWAVAIKEEILEKRMPPWSAASGYGHFANDMSLTAREISLILSWADGGAPSGVLLADEDKQPVFVPSLTGWEQGPPDAVIEVAEDQKIAADSPFRVERFEVATGLKQARWLRALQLNPADRRVIRYAAIYETRTAAGWARGRRSSQVSAMPGGAACSCRPAPSSPSKSAIAATGRSVGRRRARPLFRGEAPAQTPRQSRSRRRRVNVAPGRPANASARKRRSRRATTVAALWPRLGPGARSLEVTAIRPDGTVEPMLWVNNYRPNGPRPTS